MLEGTSFIGFGRGKKAQPFAKPFLAQQNQEDSHNFYQASSEEVSQALRFSQSAFESYAEIDLENKARFLRQIAANIAEIREPLLARAHAETALPVGRLQGETQRTIYQIHSFAEAMEKGYGLNPVIDLPDPQRSPVPKPDLRKVNVPLGPVLVLPPGNFPLAFSVAGGDCISALAAGCPVIVKAHEDHLGTSELVAAAIIKAAQETNMPEGVFQLLTGPAAELGPKLVSSEVFKAIAFTGSERVGRSIMDLAAKRPTPIPVFAEMGSINPVLVFDLADRQAVIQNLINSFTLHAGQFCTNPGLIFLPISQEEEWRSLIKSALGEIEGQAMLSKKTLSHFEQGLARLKDVIIDFGRDDKGRKPACGFVTADHYLKTPALKEEVFGPFSLFVFYRDEQELQSCVAELHGQLTATIWAEKLTSAQEKVVKSLTDKVGRILWNGVPTGVEVCRAQHHAGPYPASSSPHFTAVGLDAMLRFLKPIAFQNFPDNLLPLALKNQNPLGISRTVDGEITSKGFKV